MNKTNRVLTAILIAAILVAVAVPALASNLTKTATLTYRDIKITLDGQAVLPTDAGGNYVEPFLIDGTTYLPVRGIASALGLEVSWDAETNTVVLTSGAAGPAAGADTYREGLPYFITREKPASYNYVVNLNTGRFHKPDCRSVGDILPENLAYCTGTRDQLIDAEYSPCGNCKP